jgi:hypothetical protein
MLVLVVGEWSEVAAALTLILLAPYLAQNSR